MQFRVEEIPQKEQPESAAPVTETEEVNDESSVDVEESTDDEVSPEPSPSNEEVEVPLRKLMRERKKRQEYEAELDRIKRQHEQDAAALAEFRAAVPKIQETWQENQRLKQEREALQAQYTQLRQMAESSDELDLSQLEEANLRRDLDSVKQAIASLPDVVRAQLQEGRRQDEERRAREEQERERARQRDAARKSFEQEFNEITEGVDVLRKQKEHYLAVFENTGGAVSARELLEPIVATMAAPAIIKQRRDAAPRQQGSTAGVRSPSEPITKIQEGENLHDYLQRMKDAVRKGLLRTVE